MVAQPVVTEFPGEPGDFIQYARRLAKMEQRDVAEHMDLDPKTIGRWEKGITTPRIDQWKELATFLHAPWLIDALAGWMRGRLPLYVDMPYPATTAEFHNVRSENCESLVTAA